MDVKETATHINIQWITSEHIVNMMKEKRGDTTISQSHGNWKIIRSRYWQRLFDATKSDLETIEASGFAIEQIHPYVAKVLKKSGSPKCMGFADMQQKLQSAFFQGHYATKRLLTEWPMFASPQRKEILNLWQIITIINLPTPLVKNKGGRGVRCYQRYQLGARFYHPQQQEE